MGYDFCHLLDIELRPRIIWEQDGDPRLFTPSFSSSHTITSGMSVSLPARPSCDVNVCD